MIKSNKTFILLVVSALLFCFLATGSVSAANPPSANFTSNVTDGNAPSSVQFTDTSTNNATYWAWDFENDGIIDSNQQNPVHTYTTPGNFSVKLTAGNEAGNNTLTKLNYVNVANPLPSNRHIFINVSNDEGVKYNLDGTSYSGPNGTYYIKADGGGMNQLHITNDPGNAGGQVTSLTSPDSNISGVFYITTTGGRGYNDEIILLVSVKGQIPDDFTLHITSSGYSWTLTGAYPTSYNYVTGAVNQTFTKTDFQYGPQTAKPGPGGLGTWSLPLYPGQNINDPSTAEYLMFIDLYAGNLNSAPIDNGQVKIEYSFNHMNTFASFNAYAWCGASNQGDGISWTNNANSGYTITYIPPVANFTATPTNGKTPLTVNFTDSSTGPINSWAWDFNNDGIIDSTEQNPTYTYTKPGIYTVKLTVTTPYDSDSEIKTNFITLTPVTNTRTNKTYATIQDAIDDSVTLDGDTILVGSGPYNEDYSENVNVTKQLTISTRGKVTVTALDPNNPVFKINIGGTNSIINGFIITGATNSSGIYIDPFVNATIVGNNITGNLNGIYVGDGNVTIIGNNVTGNIKNGILIRNGNATISGNDIAGNLNGVYIEDNEDNAISVRNNITENNITNNSNVGIYVGSGSPNIHYNRICNNGLYGLEDTAKGENTSNATFNWWGNNTPMYVSRTSAPRKSDIYDAHESSHVTYDPWIVLTVNATSDLLKTGAKSNITADLTQDNNGNVVAGGQVPDGAPVVFAYALGTVNPVNTTLVNNTAKTVVTGGSSSGVANVTATVDGYTTGIPITMDTIAPIVSSDVLGGTYNNTQTVTLTTNDPTSTIYYTINGTNPTTSSTPYTGPITINSTASLKFAAIDPAGNWSPVNIQNYLIGTTPIADSDWPKFQNDLNNTGLSDYIGPQTNNTAWIFTTGSNIRYAVPVIGADGTIYIGSGRYFYALNPNGTQKWSYTAGGSIYGSAIIGGDGTIYFCEQYAVDALYSNGTLKWRYYQGQPLYGSPNIGSDGTIYVGCAGTKLIAINLDGTVKWTYTTGDSIYYSSPSIGADGTIYIGCRDRNVYAINPDGTLKWTFRTGEQIDSSPVIGSDGTIYIGSNDRTFYAINPNGTLKWEYYTGNSITGSSAIGADGTIYIGNNAGILYALNPDGTLKWNYTTSSSIQGAPIIAADGTIYFGSGDKNVYALTPDGTLKWKYTTGNSIQGSPSIGADGTLYIGSYDKKLYAFKDPNADLNTSVVVDNPTPKIGDNLNVTFNVTNNGLGTAFRTVLTYTLPEWLKYVDVSANMGTVFYNATNRMVTWNLGDFAVTDAASMNLLAQVIESGIYNITPSLTTITSDPNLMAHTGSEYVTVSGNVVNTRTGTTYDTIQEAIDDVNTLDGDTINVGIGNYTENVVVNKQLILNTLGSVTVMALNMNNPVFSIPIAGNNSVINGFTITGAINSYGVYIAPFVNSTIANNTIIENGFEGIFIDGNSNTINLNLNTITGNTIRNNERDGIRVQSGSPTINSNNIYGNEIAGIRVQSGNPTINSNNIYSNEIAGIRVQSGSPIVHFNRIYNNGLYGLHDVSTTPNVTNATYNWWGTNNPTYVMDTSMPGKSDIYDAHTSAHVVYNPWIVLTANAAPDLLKAGDNATITAYLTHDSNGNVITGQVPDGIPVSFSTDSGKINPENTTKSGSAISTLTAGNVSGTTNASITVDACTVSVPVTVDTVAPTVTNNVPGGTYNTTQNVNLTVDEPGTIYYTTNGTNPTTSSNVFQNPIVISTTTTLRYAAVDHAGNWSPIYLINYVIGPGGLADTPQPEFQNNNNHTGQSDYSGPQTNTTFWNYNTGSGMYGYGSPTIGVDGTIYIGNNVGILFAINPDGTQKWNYTAGSGLIRSSPTIGADGTIYLIRGSIIFALNSDGTQKWNYTMGSSTYGSPAISADGTIYIGSDDSNLYAINPDGTLKWKYLTEPGLYYNGLGYSSPAIGADGTIYIGSQNGRLYAVNPDGTLKWKYKATLSYIRCSPTIGADGTIYFRIDSGLFALNSDGTVKWIYDKPLDTRTTSTWSTPAIGTDGTIYFAQGYSVGALNSDGTLKWAYYTDCCMYYSSAAIGADGTIYFGCESNIFAFNPDGTLKWTHTGSTYASTIGSDGTLYFGSSDGNLYAIKDPVPVANFTAAPVNGNSPLTVQFNDTSSYAASWAWDFNNDGVVDSTERNPTYTYSNTGRYTVKLTVTNAAGNVSEIKTNYITVDNVGPVPSANLPSGSYNTNITVNLTAVDDLDPNPQIYYTLDDSEPTTSSTLYTGPIIITNEGTTTLKFIAVDATGNWSPVYNQTYTIDITVPTVTANPVGGNYDTTKSVVLTASDESTTTIYYTTDGSTPTNHSTQYTGPININTTTTMKFMAIDAAGNQGTVQTEIYNISSDIFVQITPSKTNPTVGDKVTYTFKLGNNGPGDASNVVFTYVVPEGVEYAGANVDQGTVNYDPTTRTLTWTVGNVAAGVDPYLWLNLNILSAGTFNIQPTVTVDGYNPGLINNIGSLLINAAIAPTTTENTNTVNAATTTNVQAGTIPMQTTGMPIAGLILGILCIGSGITLNRKK